MTDSPPNELSADGVLALLDQGANAIYVTDAETGRFVYVNDRACETTGYNRDELLGAHISQVEVNFNRTIDWSSFVEEVRDHPRFTIQGEHQRKDGSTFPVTVDIDLIEHAGREYVVSVILPREEQESVEREIVDTYSQYVSLFEHSPIPLLNFDLSGVHRTVGSMETNPDHETLLDLLRSKSRIRDVNLSALDLLEVEDQREIVDKVDSILTPSFRTKAVTIFEEFLQGRFRQDYELTLRTAHGAERTVLANFLVPPNGREDLSRVFVSMVDITPRRQAEERAQRRLQTLRASEKQFRQMAENIDEVFYNYSADYSEVSYVSSAYEDIWERKLDSLYENPWEFVEAIHEEDREDVLEEKQNFLDDETSTSLTTEYRIHTPDDRVKWIRDKMFAVREEGVLESIVGYARDVTEKKEAQRSLKDSLREKETLLEEIHHRVKNNMQIIASLLNVQSRQVESDTANEVLQNSIKRIRTMALVHEKLYQTNRLSEFGLESYLTSIVEHLVDFHGIKREHTEIRFEIEPVQLDLDKAITCGMIVNELVDNSLVHALKDRDDGRLAVRFRNTREEQYQLEVADNGPGLENPPETTKPKSGGFNILEALVEYELGGTLAFDSDDGLTAVVRFDLNGGE